MTQVSKWPISAKVYQRIFEIFVKVLIKIKTQIQAERFLTDFLTPTEQVMLSKRLAIAFLLEKNYDHRQISRILRVSTSTVARVKILRKLGGEGYQKLIEKLLIEENVKDFLSQVSELLTKQLGKSSKGGSSWRYLHQEIKRKRKEKPF